MWKLSNGILNISTDCNSHQDKISRKYTDQYHDVQTQNVPPDPCQTTITAAVDTSESNTFYNKPYTQRKKHRKKVFPKYK